MKIVYLMVLLSQVFLWSACSESADPATQNDTLYNRLGGLPAIEAVVDTFAAEVLATPRLAVFFENADLTRFRILLTEMICEAAEGPCSYSGRSMSTIHHGMGIASEDFEALVGALRTTLERFQVPLREQNELIRIMGLQRESIVENP